ncbi:hypothetical protein M426DRAFT_7293 [Hypoxylon sp. CI-4A]|nr:hypothetical protein M426DRAFT_7293 [Hypoxylon sp. CI-4A]
MPRHAHPSIKSAIEVSALTKINALHIKASQLLRPQDRLPTRAEYGAAVSKADTATEIALRARLRTKVINRCEAFQRTCLKSLLKAYSKAENYDRRAYDKSSSQASENNKRHGKIINTDPGEHLIEAFEAVRIGKILDDQVKDNVDRKIRWVDEVKDEPIRTIGIAL